MIRLFDTHKLRKSTELSGRLWDFEILPGMEGEEKRKAPFYGGTGEEGFSGKVVVPHCLETLPGLGNYRGWSAYETTFEGGGNLRLEFKGVSHFARVMLDQEELGEHYGSYTPFSFVARNVVSGRHTLRVLVDNAFREEYALDIPNDYMSYGGISRGVVVEEVPDCFISSVHFTPLEKCEDSTGARSDAAFPRDGKAAACAGGKAETAPAVQTGSWLAEVKVCCENLLDRKIAARLGLFLEGREIAGRELDLAPGTNEMVFERLLIDGVEDWSMQTPVLYPLKAVLSMEGVPIDDWIDRIGFRTIRVVGKHVLLNGRPIRIKGFCRHEDHPQYGCALPVQAICNDLRLVKDMGGNAVRTSHYPNDELFLDLCDELGLLVWEENHARGIHLEQMRNPAFEPHCEQVIREMIGAHYNHPSICIWGIMNECASDTEYGRSCYEAQFSLIRSLDQSRPCSFASCRFFTDICQDLPDVCSWNIYPYWYVTDQTAEEYAGRLMDWLSGLGYGGKPFLVTEVGAGAIYGFHDPSRDVWSEELQAEILKRQLTELASLEGCMGTFIWQLCDVRVARDEWPMKRPKSRNNKGVVDEYRRPKLSYQEVKKIYTALPDYLD